MSYYERKTLQDRANRIIGAGVSFFFISPAFGIIAGAFTGSALALYLVTAIFAIIGLVGIAAGIQQHREIKYAYDS